jgi:MinD-like ATPase involved in chromosome partitioning or flagellar assembly
MEMISILVCDNDREYVSRLGSALARMGKELEVEIVSADNLRCDTTVIPLQDSLDSTRYDELDGVKRNSPGDCDDSIGIRIGKQDYYDFILTNYSSSKLLRQIYPSSFIWILSETSDTESHSGEDRIRTVYRYGPVSRLLSLIREEYSLFADKDWLTHYKSSVKTGFVCCMGLSGGCGASSIAIGLGREFAAYREKRVLYLSMEHIEADMLCTNVPDGSFKRDIGSFLYILLRKKPKLSNLLIESYIKRDQYGLARFHPSAGLNDVLELSNTELELFFQTLTEADLFDLIIFDLGSYPDERNKQIASLCDSVILVESGLCHNGKADKSMALIQNTWEISGQIIIARNMVEGYGADTGQDSEKPDKVASAGFMSGLANKLKKGVIVEKSQAKISAANDTSRDDINTSPDKYRESNQYVAAKNVWAPLQVEIPFERDNFSDKNEFDFQMTGGFGYGVKRLADLVEE